jgi:nucleotide-binding universal stress UspA family protein
MYAKILVPVDAGRTAQAGLDQAIRLAVLCGAQLQLLHVADELPFTPEGVVHEAQPSAVASPAIARGHALLAGLQARVSRDHLAAEVVLVEGSGRPLHAVVIDHAQRWGAELIVLGTHGRRGVERLLAGSVAEQVVRHSDVPVLLVREATDAGERGLQPIAAAIA